jgi:hypothetical protein
MTKEWWIVLLALAVAGAVVLFRGRETPQLEMPVARSDMGNTTVIIEAPGSVYTPRDWSQPREQVAAPVAVGATSSLSPVAAAAPAPVEPVTADQLRKRLDDELAKRRAKSRASVDAERDELRAELDVERDALRSSIRTEVDAARAASRVEVDGVRSAADVARDAMKDELRSRARDAFVARQELTPETREPNLDDAFRRWM